MIVAGIGCRRGVAPASIVALVGAAQDFAGCRVGTLAAPAFKRGEAGLREAADSLGLPLTFVSDAALRAVQARCPTRSEAAERAVGVGSVAEAAALAASGGALVLARISGHGVTCALARA